MAKKLPTIKEIARLLNISPSTVSRALHDHPSIGLRTKMQVKNLANELHYEPNQTALNFQHGKTYTIGVILPYLVEEFFSMAISGIEDHAFAHGYTVLIGQSREDEMRERLITLAMKKHRVDGLIVSVSKHTRSFTHFESFGDYDIPVVYFDRIPDLEHIHSVSCDIREGAIQAVHLLANLGHSRIALLNGPDCLKASRERNEGYKTALSMHQFAIQDDLIRSTDLTTSSTCMAMKELLDLKDRPTAVLSFNDYVSLDAIRFAKSIGVGINTELSFVSFANISINHYLDAYPLASVEQFPYRQGEKAAEVLLDLLEKQPVPENHVQLVLGTELILHEHADEAVWGDLFK